MKYRIINRSEKQIVKDISKIPKQAVSKIFDKIEKLSITGLSSAQVKKLNNYALCDYRLRIGDYRILFNFDVDKKEIVIFRILHRSKLY